MSARPRASWATWSKWCPRRWPNFAENVAGKRGKAIFPLVATLFFFILLGNWFKLLPGAESIGVLETPHLATSRPTRRG